MTDDFIHPGTIPLGVQERLGRMTGHVERLCLDLDLYVLPKLSDAATLLRVQRSMDAAMADVKRLDEEFRALIAQRGVDVLHGRAS